MDNQINFIQFFMLVINWIFWYESLGDLVYLNIFSHIPQLYYVWHFLKQKDIVLVWCVFQIRRKHYQRWAAAWLITIHRIHRCSNCRFFFIAMIINYYSRTWSWCNAIVTVKAMLDIEILNNIAVAEETDAIRWYKKQLAGETIAAAS